MDCKNRIIKLRESTGLNRKDFCKLVHIPYRTMTEWELDNRHAPDYVLWLLEYYIRNEGLMVKEGMREVEILKRNNLNAIFIQECPPRCRLTDTAWMPSVTSCGSMRHTRI